MNQFRGKLPFDRASTKLKDVLLNLKSKSLYSKLKLKAHDRMRDTRQWLCTYKIHIAGSIGAAVIVAGVVYGGHQYVQANMNEVYEVYVGDELIGEVSSPDVVEKMIEAKLQEVSKKHPEVRWEMERKALHLEQHRVFMGEGEDEATVSALKPLLEAVPVGVEVVVNGEAVAIVKDQETANRILEKVKAQYSSSNAGEVQVLSAQENWSDEDVLDKGASEIQSVRIIEPVELLKREIQPNDVMDEQEVLDLLLNGDVKPAKYIVQEGDTVSGIAEKLDIPVELIYTKNKDHRDLIERDLIRVGDTLDLTMPQPAVTIETVEKLTETIAIQYDTIYEEDKTMRKGQTKTVRAGQNGKKQITYQLTKVNGLLMEEKVQEEVVLDESIPAVVKRGTKVVLGEGTGKFVWPVVSPKLSSGYGSRWGRQHTGIDIISKNKTILAADTGKVSFAGTKSGYGKVVIIDHKNGYQTLYAHLSKISVDSGDIVEKGDKVGVMGNTGRSTGVHLHFEVIVDGSERNPLKYLN